MATITKYILYHGTPKRFVKSILRDGFKIQTSDTHWMGKGVYFYDSVDKSRKFVSKTRSGETPAVIKADIETNDENLLDLVNNKTHRDNFAKFIKSQEPEYSNSIRLKRLDMSKEKERNESIFLLKCALFDYYCLLNDIELVICEHNTHPGSYTQMLLKSLSIDENVEVQYCAKTLDIIKNIICV